MSRVADRIEKRVADLDSELGMGERAEQISLIEAEETESGNRRAVAGFDYTFSVPKSVSCSGASPTPARRR